MNAIHRIVAVGLGSVIAAVLSITTPAQVERSLHDDLMAYGKEVARVANAKSPNKESKLKVKEDAAALSEYFTPNSAVWKHAVKTKKLAAEPKRTQVVVLAGSLWAELRLGKNKVPLDTRLTAKMLMKAMDATVYCNFTSNSGGASVIINPRGDRVLGTTNNGWYLPPGQNYTVVFRKGNAEDSQSFTPMQDGDSCNGNL